MGKEYVNANIGGINLESREEMEKILKKLNLPYFNRQLTTLPNKVEDWITDTLDGTLHVMSLVMGHNISFLHPESQKIEFYQNRSRGRLARIGEMVSYKIERDGGGGVDTSDATGKNPIHNTWDPIVRFLTNKNWNIVVGIDDPRYLLMCDISALSYEKLTRTIERQGF